jgi:hypothetical protein
MVALTEFAKACARKMGAFVYPTPSVPKDQRLKASYGFRTWAPLRSHGWLILTEEKIIFERAVSFINWIPRTRFTPSPNIDVAVRDIVRAERMRAGPFDHMPGCPVLALSLTSGEQLFVEIGDADYWLEPIERARERAGAPSAYEDLD